MEKLFSMISLAQTYVPNTGDDLPIPLIIGGVAALGVLIFILTRKKKQ